MEKRKGSYRGERTTVFSFGEEKQPLRKFPLEGNFFALENRNPPTFVVRRRTVLLVARKFYELVPAREQVVVSAG